MLQHGDAHILPRSPDQPLGAFSENSVAHDLQRATGSFSRLTIVFSSYPSRCTEIAI